MDTHSTVLGQAGAPIILVIDGHEWRFSYVTQVMKAEYESWLESKVRARMGELKASLAPEDYQQVVCDVLEKMALGKYGWGEAAWRDSLKSAAGLQRLLQLMLVANHPEARTWTAARFEALMAADQEGIARVMEQAITGRATPEKNEAGEIDDPFGQAAV